jgi:hypothetical protein
VVGCVGVTSYMEVFYVRGAMPPRCGHVFLSFFVHLALAFDLLSQKNSFKIRN